MRTEQLVSRYLGYGLVLFLSIAVAGYFIPWHQNEDGLLFDSWSMLTSNSSEFARDLSMVLIACFVVVVTSLALTMYWLFSEGRAAQALRVSPLLSSISVAAPLIYIQSLMQLAPEWRDLWDRLAHAGPGWYLSLIFSVGACLLATYACYRGFGCVRDKPSPVDELAAESRISYTTIVPVVLAVAGVAVAVVGYFEVWSSGTIFTMFENTTVSKTGVDETPLMCIVPMAAVAALFLELPGLILIGERRVSFLLLVAQCALAVGIALTLFWGVTIGDYVLAYRSLSGEFSLQPGWYICLSGQVLAFASLTVGEMLRPVRRT